MVNLPNYLAKTTYLRLIAAFKVNQLLKREARYRARLRDRTSQQK